jgi:hypothetical protein
MPVQADMKAALEEDRENLIQVLADYRLLPTVVDRDGGSSLLGESSSPTITLEAQAEDTVTLDRQTTARVVDTLGLDSEAAATAVRDEIESHDAWG